MHLFFADYSARGLCRPHIAELKFGKLLTHMGKDNTLDSDRRRGNGVASEEARDRTKEQATTPQK